MAVKIAFTGTGYISRIHAKAAQTHPDVELVAVVNHQPESMAKFANDYGIPRQYTTVEEMIKDGAVDGLVISTPNYLHASQSIAALNAGIHVMVEKPMAMNANEAQKMVEASEKFGALLMVAHCWRFDEEVLWVKRHLDTGNLGDIVRTKGCGVHTHWGPGGWFTQSKFAGGGALADMGIHAIDTVRFLLGDPQPVSVLADLSTHYGEYDVDDTGVIYIKWDNGTTSYIESGWWQPHTVGPEAHTQLYGNSGFAQLFPTYVSFPDRETRTEKRIESGFPPVRDPHCPQVMYDTQLAYFVDCMQNKTKPDPGGLTGWTNMRIVDAAYQSSQTGKIVTL